MENIIRSINNIRKSPVKLRDRIVQSELPIFLQECIALLMQNKRTNGENRRGH
jgi:hypothetical protein